MDNNKFVCSSKCDLRSQKILGKDAWRETRAIFKALGCSDDDLERPIIGIANTWNEINPGHQNLRMVADYVRRGIYRAGGTPVEFGTIGICDGVATANEGMRYALPHREVVASSIELMAEGSRLDGLVLLGSCDKIVPGLLMAAARLNLPCVVVNGGPAISGPDFNGHQSDICTTEEGTALYAEGKCTLQELDDLEDVCAPTCGSCTYLGTANTMCCLTEAMGLSLPGSALVPAIYNERLRIAFQSGEVVVDLVRKNICARDIITEHSISNAITTLMGMGGSTNAVLHLVALGHEIGMETSAVIDMIDRASWDIPLVAKVYPSSCYDMVDLHKAGGVQQILKELRSKLYLDCLCVNEKTIGENIDAFRNKLGSVNRKIIRTIDDPFERGASIGIMHGNLAPHSAVAKPNTVKEELQSFTGEAIVFESEEECSNAIIDGRVKAGRVIVVRYEGPKGGPGMREMYRALKLVESHHLENSVAFITDGRFSGMNNGCAIGHISPEAAEGGPIAIVQDGDRITVDIQNRELHLHLTEREIEERLKKWAYEPKKLKGFLSLYAKLAKSADQGGIMV